MYEGVIWGYIIIFVMLNKFCCRYCITWNVSNMKTSLGMFTSMSSQTGVC